MKAISYVLPVYNESLGIKEFYQQLAEALKTKKSQYTFELIFVNDGSKDDSLEILKGLGKKDKRLKVLSFSRNFGHQAAITAGLDYAKGDAVIIMDTDLQDPPKVSLELIEKWEEGYGVVYAKRRTRRDTLFKKITAHVYYRSLRTLADIDIPADTGDFRLLDKTAVRELRKFREKNRFVRGLVSFIGFRQTAVEFDRLDRLAGETHYPFRKMVKLATDGITSFSTVPLKIITRVGMAMFVLSMFGIAYALAMKLFFPTVTVSGWTLLIIAILLIGGVQMISMGVIATYIGRIYTEAQMRPLYIVEEVIEQGDGKD